MNAQNTRPTPPVWLNLHAVIEEEACEELRHLGDLVEQAIEDIAPLLEKSYRSIQHFQDCAAGAGEGPWDAIYIHSGAQRLSDLLYLLAAHVDGATGEKVDESYDIAWLRQAQSEAGQSLVVAAITVERAEQR